jgi:hypothetical protein
MHPNRLITALLMLIATAGANAERKSAAAEEITLVMDAFKAIAAVQEPNRGHFEDLLEAEISSFGCELNPFLYADGNIRCSGQLLRFAGRWGLEPIKLALNESFNRRDNRRIAWSITFALDQQRCRTKDYFEKEHGITWLKTLSVPLVCHPLPDQKSFSGCGTSDQYHLGKLKSAASKQWVYLHPKACPAWISIGFDENDR